MNNTTVAGLISLLIICGLLAFQFVEFEAVENAESSSLSESIYPKLLEEIKSIKSDLHDLHLSLQESPPEALTREALTDAIHAELEEFQNNLPDAQMNEVEKIVEVEKIKYVNQYVAANDSSPARWWKKLPFEEQIGEFGKDTCEKKTSIYFLKTSKTGGTTFANILMRFGFAREGTNYLMGESNNGAMFFLNGYLPFNENLCFLGRDIPDRPLFDISYVHMRYNRTAVDRVMKKDVFKVSILRDPLSNFMSSWKYYNGLTKEMRVKIREDMKPEDRGKDDNKNANFYGEMDQFLTKPWDYLESFHFAHSAYLFVVNPQFLFFGYPSYLLSMPYQRGYQLVDAWIHEIEQDFDHMIILEDLDRSLAVLMLKLCWSVEDVMHLKLNGMKPDGRTITPDSQRRLRQFNWADYRLYDYYKNKLNREVKKIGVEKVQAIVDRITHAAEVITEECLKPDMSTGWITAPIVKPEKARNQTCQFMTKDITGWIEADQIERWKHEYPEWRKPESDRKKDDKIKGKELPNFCGPNDNFAEWILKKDVDFRAFLDWKTNEYDYRNGVPSYLDNFKQPLNPKVDGMTNRIFN